MSFSLQLPKPIPDFDILSHEACFLILDGSQIEKLELLLLQQDLQLQAIFPLRFLPLREVSPFIIKLTPTVMSWFTQYNQANVGYIISSDANIDQLATILSDFFEVLSPYGSKVFFKVGQPEAMNVILNDQECHIWAAISKAWLPTREGWISLCHDEKIDIREKPKAYHLSDQQWKQLGDITRRNTVEKVHQHLSTYFPEALQQHNYPLLWVKEWVQKAHDMQFETDTDVLHFFNILALLGENVLKTDRYPHIKQLLETASAQTPSMRVAKADELAHKEVSHVK